MLSGELPDLKLSAEEGPHLQRHEANKNPITATVDVTKIGYTSSTRHLHLKTSIWHPIQAMDIINSSEFKSGRGKSLYSTSAPR